MTAEITFAQMDDAPDVPRDRWGRPLITPPDGGKPGYLPSESAPSPKP